MKIFLKNIEGFGNTFDLSKGYIVVVQHPVTTEYESAFEQIKKLLWLYTN